MGFCHQQQTLQRQMVFCLRQQTHSPQQCPLGKLLTLQTLWDNPIKPALPMQLLKQLQRQLLLKLWQTLNQHQIPNQLQRQ